jgi:hypothetical protein
MTREELKALDDSIPYEEQKDNGLNSLEEMAEGLLLINKYAKRTSLCAEHDIIYAGDSGVLEKMSEEDCRRMLVIGWHWSRDVDCWASHV